MDKLLYTFFSIFLTLIPIVLPLCETNTVEARNVTHFTSADLQRAGVSKLNADKYAYWLSFHAERYGVTTSRRKIHFLSQIAHESGGFKWSREMWGPTYNQQRYEYNKGLGNNRPGDGYRFRGRGLIQITGRYNYVKMGNAIGLNLVANPELLESPRYAVQSSFIYWTWVNGNSKADYNNLRATTKAVNGSYNGYSDRVLWFNRFSSIYR